MRVALARRERHIASPPGWAAPASWQLVSDPSLACLPPQEVLRCSHGGLLGLPGPALLHCFEADYARYRF
jgi:hypothetical protein